MAVMIPPAVPIGWDPSSEPPAVAQPTLFDLPDRRTKTPPSSLSALSPERIQQLARCVVEVLGGQRPAAHLARWTSEAVQAKLALAVRRSPGPPLRIGSLHCDHSLPDVVEVAMRVVMGGRSAAMAFRLERQRRAWVCTAWEHRAGDLEPGKPRPRRRRA